MAITYVGSGAEAAATAGGNPLIPYPASIALDDFLWVPVSASVTTLPSSTAMSAAGFTRLYGVNSLGGSPVGGGYYKWATGSETGTATFNSPGGLSIGRMFAYRGVDKANPFDVPFVNDGWNTSVTAYAVPAQTTTMAGCAAVLHAWSNATSGTWTPPASHTELMDSTAGGTVNATFVGHRLNLVAGDTGVRTITRSAGSRGGVAGIILRPAVTSIAATSAVTLPQFVSSATATVGQSADVAVTLPRFQSSAFAEVTNRAAVEMVLPQLHSAAVADVRLTAAINTTLPQFQSAAVATIPIAADIAIALPQFTSSAFADVYLDKSAWRNITITVGTPSGHTLTAGPAIGHPMHAGPPRSEP